VPCAEKPLLSKYLSTMDALAALTLSAIPSIASTAFAKDLTLVNTAINTPTVMLARTAKEKTHGRLPPSATRRTLISSSVQIPTSADPLHTAGLCLRKTGVKTCKSVFHSIHKKRELPWAGSLITP
jgi:hypothetical protein